MSWARWINRSNETHASITDPMCGWRASPTAKVSNGPLPAICWRIERDRGRRPHKPGRPQRPDDGRLPDTGDRHGGTRGGAGKAYDTAAFVANSRVAGVAPHVAQTINPHRGSNIDDRTTRRAGYRFSQVVRKRMGEANGWIKQIGGMPQTRLRGVKRVEWPFVLRWQLTT